MAGKVARIVPRMSEPQMMAGTVSRPATMRNGVMAQAMYSAWSELRKMYLNLVKRASTMSSTRPKTNTNVAIVPNLPSVMPMPASLDGTMPVMWNADSNRLEKLASALQMSVAPADRMTMPSMALTVPVMTCVAGFLRAMRPTRTTRPAMTAGWLRRSFRNSMSLSFLAGMAG